MPRNSKNQLIENETDREEFNHEDLKDHATKERISQHLSDINDTISEDDIRNIKTNLTSPRSNSEAVADDVITGEDEDETEGHVNKTAGHNELISPWNIIDEEE